MVGVEPEKPVTPERQATAPATIHAADATKPPEPTTAYLSLGANLGDRRGSLRLALQRLAEHPQVSLDTNRDVARLFQTTPVGCEDAQPLYLNTAAGIRTTLSPTALLTLTQRIESELGRVRQETQARSGRTKPKNHPRTIDIDILLFGDTAYHYENLELPHPRLTERRFVLEPLADLIPDHRLNPADRTVAATALACRRRYPHQAVEVVEERGWAV